MAHLEGYCGIRRGASFRLAESRVPVVLSVPRVVSPAETVSNLRDDLEGEELVIHCLMILLFVERLCQEALDWIGAIHCSWSCRTEHCWHGRHRIHAIVRRWYRPIRVEWCSTWAKTVVTTSAPAEALLVGLEELAKAFAARTQSPFCRRI